MVGPEDRAVAGRLQVKEPGEAGFPTCSRKSGDQFEGVKSRRRPNAASSSVHASHVLAHLSGSAHRIGNLAFMYNPATGRFNDDRANAMIKPPAGRASIARRPESTG